MSIRPVPITYKCRSCGWSKIFAPRSDALTEEFPDMCPKCGNAKLSQEADSDHSSSLKKLIETAKQTFLAK